MPSSPGEFVPSKVGGQNLVRGVQGPAVWVVGHCFLRGFGAAIKQGEYVVRPRRNSRAGLQSPECVRSLALRDQRRAIGSDQNGQTTCSIRIIAISSWYAPGMRRYAGLTEFRLPCRRLARRLTRYPRRSGGGLMVLTRGDRGGDASTLDVDYTWGGVVDTRRRPRAIALRRSPGVS
jgi:hypothetical protein